MKKVLFALPLIASASWAGTTYYSGSQAQPAYEKLLADLNSATGSLFTLESTDYQAGFTNSVAITSVSLKGQNEELFRLKHEMQHSPVGSSPSGTRFSAASIETRIVNDSIDDEDLRELIAQFDGGEALTLYTDVAFTGDVSNDLQISSLSMQDEKGDFSFSGGRYEINNVGSNLTITGTLGEILMKPAQGGEVSVAESSTNMNLKRIGKGVYTGTQNIIFPSLLISDPSQGLDIKLSAISLSSNTDLYEGKLNSQSTLAVADISAPIPLNSASWDFKLNGFSVEGMERYTAAMNRLSSMTEAELENTDAVMTELGEGFKSLFLPNSSFLSELALNNDGGDVVGNFKVDYLGNGDNAIATVGDLLNSVAVKLNLEADSAALDMTPVMFFLMQPGVDQYIKSAHGKYYSDIRISESQLNINGVVQRLDNVMGVSLNEPLDFSSLRGI